MKRIFLSLALALLAVSANAQSRQIYDSDFKYGFFSNWTLGVSGQYSNQHGVSNVGISALATKRVGDYWRLRYEAGINGLQVKDGFDRYGTALTGVCFDFVPWAYIYADGGAVVNPTAKGWLGLGLAADAGLGLNVNFGRHSLLYTEAGVERVQCNGEWGGTVFARLGYAACLGVTEGDREAIEHDQTMRSEYGELKQENRILKSEMQKCTEAGATMQAAAEQMQLMVLSLQAQCTTLEKEKKELQNNVVDYSMFKFHFNCGSVVLSEIQESRVGTLAAYINSTSGQWRVDGYASTDGEEWTNMILSQQRAEMVCDLLEAFGVDKARLVPIGNGESFEYGEDSPLNRLVVVSKIVP